jgi:septal ring factor EnvC (AmiA/AmiB activator)
MSDDKTLEAVMKLLELKQKLASNPKKQEIDTQINALSSAYGERLQEVESLEAELVSLESEINTLIDRRREVSCLIHEKKESVEDIEYDLEKLNELNKSLLDDFKLLDLYKNELITLSGTINEVTTLLNTQLDGSQ